MNYKYNLSLLRPTHEGVTNLTSLLTNTGAGWAMFCSKYSREFLHDESCFLGNEMGVYDAELHALHEALNELTRLDTKSKSARICIDNKVPIYALVDNKDISEPARNAIYIKQVLSNI
jgi:hypothetical protein